MANLELEVKAAAAVPAGQPNPLAGTADPTDGGLNVHIAGGTPPSAPATFLASATLPASGAWTAATPFAIPSGMKRVGFYVDYTGGSAPAAVQYRVRKGIASNKLASEQIANTTLTLNPPTALQGIYDAIYQRPVTDVTPVSFPVDVDVEGGWTYIVLDLAEYGDTANPGTAAITIVGSY